MRLRQLKEQFPDRITLTPKAFILLGEDQTRTFSTYYLQHRQAARQMSGLPYDLPPVGAPYPRSSLWALEAAKWVETHHPEAFESYDLALFEAFFQHTRDIGSVAVLVGLAEELGLPGQELEEALRARRFADAVWEDHREALAQGVTGIPTVRIGEHTLTGAVPYEDYVRAVQTLVQGETIAPNPGRGRPLLVR